MHPLTPVAFHRLLHNGGGGGGCSSGELESVAYRMSMLRRPSSVRKKGLTWNSCSLIGRLDAPVRPFDGSSDEDPRAYTFLCVTPSSPAPSSSSSKLTLSPSLPAPQPMLVLFPFSLAAEFFFQFLLEIGCILMSFSVVHMMWILLCNMLFPYLLRRKYGLTTM